MHTTEPPSAEPDLELLSTAIPLSTARPIIKKYPEPGKQAIVQEIPKLPELPDLDTPTPENRKSAHP